ncbi:hypothetical protein [Streptomyces sp. Isolate_45]|uniref:hypothetical protein n=1 Tax=Streptomyces sp. Isolate_45 TaxID=2950111 RepID=UPI0024819BDD|nr:hypothetical protein [Streptomyces sp. Isolate_45]MDA5284727.1 hypothetical protein [Streptomyces sp. Isolate_45]
MAGGRDSEQAQAVEVVADLVRERTRTFQRLRTLLREYDSAALSAYADLTPAARMPWNC